MDNHNEHRTGKLHVEDLTAFNIQLGNLVRSGLPLGEGLRSFVSDLGTGRLRTVMQEIIGDVEAGRSLDSAVSDRKHAFPSFYVSMIKAGVKSGRLDIVLKYATDSLALRQRLKNAVRESLIYPAMIVILSIIVLSIGGSLIFPAMQDVYESLGYGHPALMYLTPTWPGILWSGFMPVVGGIVIVAVLCVLLGKIPWFARRFENAKLRVPFYGRYYRSSLLSQFASTFGILLEAGVPTTEIAEAVRSVSPSPRFRDAVSGFLNKLQDGKPMSDAFSANAFFPATFILAGAGAEQSGSAGEAFIDVSEVYADMAEHYAHLFLRGFLTPVLGIIMIVIVGSTLATMWAPLVRLISLLSSLSAGAM